MVSAIKRVAAVTHRLKVSTQLEIELKAQGVAQAVVFLGPMDGKLTASTELPRIALREIERCFVKDERSVAAALLSSHASVAAGFLAPRGSKQRVTRLSRSYEDVPIMRTYPALRAVLGDVHLDGLARLTQHPAVRYVASSLPLCLVRPTAYATVTKPKANTTWGIEELEIPRLWRAGLHGNGIRLGHLDTGVDISHPTLSKAVRGYMLTDYDGFQVPGARPHDTQEHGTHTAATLAGRAVGGRHVGIAPEADLYCTTVIDGGNVTARILAGLDWVVRQGVKIINLSLGLRGYHDDFHALLEAIRSRGILTVAAVGNEFAGASRSPGNYDNVLSVGACDSKGAVAEFSSSQWFQPGGSPYLVPSLVAPGVRIVSAKSGGGYLELSGTSMATPHVAGLAALLWSARPSASLADIESAISNSCALGAMPHERANHGLPNGPRAYELLMGRPLPTTRSRKSKTATAGSKRAEGKARSKTAQVVRRKKSTRRPKKK